MKKTNLIFATAIWTACGVMAQEPFIIDGTVDNAPAGTVLVLFKNAGNVGTAVANDTVREGRFHFEVPLTDEEVYEFSITAMLNGAIETPMGTDFKGQAGKKAVITGKNLNTRVWRVVSDVPGQHTMNLFTENSRELLDSLQNLSRQEFGLVNRMRKKDTPKEERDSLRKQYSIFGETHRRLTDSISTRDVELMSRIPVDEVWLDEFASAAVWARDKRGTREHDTLLALYNNLTPEQKLTSQALEAEGMLFPKTKVKPGDDATDAEMPDMEGKMRRLSDLKGRYQLLDFWSSGCGPCIFSMPELKELAAEYGDSLCIVSISIDTDHEQWRKASEQHGITWLNLNDPKGLGGLISQYSETLGIPTYAIIDPDGKVLDIWTGFRKGIFKEKLKQFIK